MGAVPSDYDRDPERWQVNRAVRRWCGSGDVHAGVNRSSHELVVMNER